LINFKDISKLVTGLITNLIIDQVIHLTISLTEEIEQKIVGPLIDDLMGDGKSGLLNCAQDQISNALSNALYEGTSSLTSYLKFIAADLYREINKTSNERLKKLATLRNFDMVGRWIEHIDKAIAFIHNLQRVLPTPDRVLQEVSTFLSAGLTPPNSKLYHELVINRGILANKTGNEILELL